MSDPKNEAIITRNLTKRFNTVTAVENLSLTIHKGEIFGLLGPNGAGKTTTIRMLGALIAPTGGEAWVAGRQIGRDDQEIRRNVRLISLFQVE